MAAPSVASEFLSASIHPHLSPQQQLELVRWQQAGLVLEQLLSAVLERHPLPHLLLRPRPARCDEPICANAVNNSARLSVRV